MYIVDGQREFSEKLILKSRCTNKPCNSNARLRTGLTFLLESCTLWAPSILCYLTILHFGYTISSCPQAENTVKTHSVESHLTSAKKWLCMVMYRNLMKIRNREHLSRNFVLHDLSSAQYDLNKDFNFLKTKTNLHYIQFIPHREHHVLQLAIPISKRSILSGC